MPMPSIHDLTLPLLRLAAEQEVSYAGCRDRLADLFGLTPEEREEMLASGAQTRFVNRIRWAKVELGMASLVENTRTKHFRATERGRQVLAQDPPRIDYRFLMQFEEYRDKIERSRKRPTEPDGSATVDAMAGRAELTGEAATVDVEAAPEEQIEAARHLGRGATKGVFVTTSSFTREAGEYAALVPQRVTLINGQDLTDLMIRCGVGARTSRTIDLKKVDEDFFAEEPA